MAGLSQLINSTNEIKRHFLLKSRKSSFRPTVTAHSSHYPFTGCGHFVLKPEKAFNVFRSEMFIHYWVRQQHLHTSYIFKTIDFSSLMFFPSFSSFFLVVVYFVRSSQYWFAEPWNPRLPSGESG